jgi:hypothetical protein
MTAHASSAARHPGVSFPCANVVAVRLSNCLT